MFLNVIYFLYQFYDRDTIKTSIMPALEKESLTLISETRDAVSLKNQDDFNGNPFFPGDAPAGPCFIVGQVRSIEDGHKVLDGLLSVDIKSKLKILDRWTGEFGYQVMIPPAPSLAEAFSNLRELRAQNIEGNVITKQANALAISLGFFATLESAKEFQNVHSIHQSIVTKSPIFERIYIIESDRFLEPASRLILEPLNEYIDLNIGQVDCSRY
ncbi:MAG: hypothetical protein CBC93_00525 [Gammaproteobacteria bacterium TMED133]|nr:MAG: hypothetical protein CBC93_00525 [Gammaproteobacteria bacterium TMED133]